MPICSKCHCWIEKDAICLRCGDSPIEMTAVDARVAPPANVEPLRPTRRPPVPLLVALDDDSDMDGEVRRLRDAETTIGRRGADWNFGCDLDMSATHAKVIRTIGPDGRSSWRLIDLESSNGSFIKVSCIELSQIDHLMIGAVRARWEHSVSAEPQLRVYDGTQDGRLLVFRSNIAVAIGSDPATAQVILNHRSIEPMHAVLKQVGSTWQLEDQSSRNGVWQRCGDSPLVDEARFMLGEQRFLFRVPASSNLACVNQP